MIAPWFVLPRRVTAIANRPAGGQSVSGSTTASSPQRPSNPDASSSPKATLGVRQLAAAFSSGQVRLAFPPLCGNFALCQPRTRVQACLRLLLHLCLSVFICGSKVSRPLSLTPSSHTDSLALGFRKLRRHINLLAGVLDRLVRLRRGPDTNTVPLADEHNLKFPRLQHARELTHAVADRQRVRRVVP